MNPLFTRLTARGLAAACALIFTWNISFAQHNPELWGSTSAGGPDRKGYIFKYDVRGNQLTRMAYFNKNLFINYYANFFAEKNGLLYAIKGQNDSADHSALISWDPVTNEIKTIYKFNPDRYRAVSSMLAAFNGKYYGFAWGGFKGSGQPVNGIIFEWDPATNAVTNKYYFEDRTKGINPWGELLLHNGKFYGVASGGGSYDNGTLFEWDAATNVFTVKAHFSPSTGATPNGFLQLHNGRLYGMSLIGGTNNLGSIFEYNLSTGTLSKLHDFGARVWGKPVVANGKLYTIEQTGWPEIIEYDLNNRAATRHAPFTGASILLTDASLTYHNNTFYVAGRKSFTDSTLICHWKPGQPALARIGGFTVETAGHYVQSPLTLFKGRLYGITEYGSAAGRGGIFEVDSAAGKVNVKNHFGSYIDAYTFAGPGSNLIYHKNRFYATSTNGGHNDVGVLFSVNPETGLTSRLHDFATTAGHYPWGHLTLDQSGVLQGIVIASPGSSIPYYEYDLNNGSLQWKPNPGHSDLHYIHQTQNAYLAIDSFLYVHREYKSATEPAGIYRCKRGTQNFTLYYAFPLTVLPWQETGLTSYSGKLIALAKMSINGSFKDAIYEFDPVTLSFRYKVVSNVAGVGPAFSGQPVELNNKLYMMTMGGCFSHGSLLEWDRVADTVIQHCITNPLTVGTVFGTPTVADGKLYGYTTNGIFCFDPADTSFKLVYNGNPSFFGGGGTQHAQKLTLRMSNTSPKITAAAAVDICLRDSLTRDVSFTVTDAEADAFSVTAATSDTTIVHPSRMAVTHVGGQQYKLRFTAENKAGSVTISILATDTMHAGGTKHISIRTSSPAPVSFTIAKDTFCARDSAFLLSGGLPAGGIYLVDGMQADSLRPGNMTQGRHTILYRYANGACADSVAHDIFVAECHGVITGRAPFTAYPNPSRGEVRIDNRDYLLSTVTVFTASGNQVMQQQYSSHPMVVDLRKLKNGLYYITVTNQNGTVSTMIELLR